MDFVETAAGQRFFSNQLPDLITALNDIAAALKAPQPVIHLEQEAAPDFLTKLYYGCHDPLEEVDHQALKVHAASMISHEQQLRKQLTPDEWEGIEQYRSLWDAGAALEREQAFITGFRYATQLFAAGLSVPRNAETTN